MVILKAKVLLNNAMDFVALETNLPCSIVKDALPSQPPLSVSFYATYDTGAEYIRKNFGLEPEIINQRL